MEMGALTLYRFNGEEKFSISDATILQYEDDGKHFLSFEIETAEEPLKTLPDTKELKARPNAEFNVSSNDFSLENLIGKTLTIPNGYDEKSGDFLARLYYCEHQETDDNSIKIVEQNNDMFRVIITANCVDVNYYDDSKPRTKIEIDAWFKA